MQGILENVVLGFAVPAAEVSRDTGAKPANHIHVSHINSCCSSVAPDRIPHFLMCLYLCSSPTRMYPQHLSRAGPSVSVQRLFVEWINVVWFTPLHLPPTNCSDPSLSPLHPPHCLPLGILLPERSSFPLSPAENLPMAPSC